MKQLVFLIFMIAMISSPAFADDRQYIDLDSEQIEVSDNGSILIDRTDNFADSILLLKRVSNSLDLQQFTENQVHQEVVQFFEELVTQYKFGKSDRPYVIYGALGDGWFGGAVYRLEMSEIEKLNNRDFGANDMKLKDSNGRNLIPLKVLFSNLTVINPVELNEDHQATIRLRSYVKNYQFGGNLRLAESLVENNYTDVEDKI